MFSLLRRLAAGRQPSVPPQPTEEELRAQRLAGFERDLASATQAVRETAVLLVVCGVMILIAAAYFTLGILNGIGVGWDLSQWVDNGRSGGPLWFVTAVITLIVALMLGGGIVGVVSTVRDRRLGLLRRERLVLQHDLDLADARQA